QPRCGCRTALSSGGVMNVTEIEGVARLTALTTISEIGQVNAAYVVQRGADAKARRVRLAPACPRPGLQRRQSPVLLHPRQLLLDLLLGLIQLLLVGLPRLLRLPQGEQVLLAVGAVERLRGLRLRGLA